MTQTKVIEASAQYRAGDGRLCFQLRCLPMNYLSAFVRDVRETGQQLTFIDQSAKHDEDLDEAVLAAAGNWKLDQVHSALTLSAIECRNSLESLRRAHHHVAGVFKGTMRDETEEMLARAIKGAEARLAKMEGLRDGYQLPRRPHEIRRNALSCLIVKGLEVVQKFQALEVEFEETISADFMEELSACNVELLGIVHRLQKLRERSSQKMGDNVQKCHERLKTLKERLEALELKAGVRAGLRFGDYTARMGQFL